MSVPSGDTDELLRELRALRYVRWSVWQIRDLRHCIRSGSVSDSLKAIYSLLYRMRPAQLDVIGKRSVVSHRCFESA